MKINGKEIAQDILDNLKKRVGELEEEGITPHLAVVLIGDDESSKAYVRQKELKANEIGAAITIHRFKNNFTESELLDLINELNNDPIVHGIIIQRPLPPHIDKNKVTNFTNIHKDVDGFCDNTPFDAPVALAVWRILKEVYIQLGNADITLEEWVKSKRVTIMGKGQTAGMPIITFFDKRDLPITVIDSKTENKDEILQNTDILISAVGKEHVISDEIIKNDVILIGVGMHRGVDGKMHADYSEENISTKAAFYTPVPGGVGPVNVAMLLSNLVKSCENN
jgi:methylenetetrahydrofolate dehydrogenase (NADP+)/methenyltetrahydrofolate cyclohydrolase